MIGAEMGPHQISAKNDDNKAASQRVNLLAVSYGRNLIIATEARRTFYGWRGR
jgi:hypothetical protein